MISEKQEFLKSFSEALNRNVDNISLIFYKDSNVALSKKILGDTSSKDLERLTKKIEVAMNSPSEATFFKLKINPDKLAIFNKLIFRSLITSKMKTEDFALLTRMLFSHINPKFITENYDSSYKEVMKDFIYADLSIKYLKNGGFGLINKMRFDREEKEEFVLKLLEKYHTQIVDDAFVQLSVYTYIRNNLTDNTWEQFKPYLPKHAHQLKLSEENLSYVKTTTKYCIMLEVDYQSIINRHAKLMKKSAIDEALLVINRALSKSKDKLGLDTIIAISTDPKPIYHMVSSNPINENKLMFVFNALIDEYVNLQGKNKVNFDEVLASTVFKHTLDFDTQKPQTIQTKVTRKKI